MSKWADYVITCVNYTTDRNRIATVGVHADNPETERTIWSRDRVVKELENDKTFVTAVKEKSEWKKGAEVQRRKINGEWFIQTEANGIAKDNLGELPPCEQPKPK